jgi:dTDP-4-dehydrorhamnose 3,5-epimerase
MTFERIGIDGLLELTPRVFEDERGYFFESFNQRTFNEAVGEEIIFVQDNESLSSKNVLRGMHFQTPPYAQGKLVRVTQGAVLDVAVDLRKNSKTYGQYHKCVLSAKNKKQFWIPAGFAHGFLTLEENTVFNYKCTNYYNQASELALNWNDPSLAIEWELNTAPVLSAKDQNNPAFTNFSSPF